MLYRIETEDIHLGHREGHDPEVLEKNRSVFRVQGRADEYGYDLALFTALQCVRGWHFRKQFDEIGVLTTLGRCWPTALSWSSERNRVLQQRGELPTHRMIAEIIDHAFGPQ